MIRGGPRDEAPVPRANADRLRTAIDRGAGGKVAFPDPATSPLGTDDEAAGAPPSTERVDLARRTESATPTPSTLRGDRRGSILIAWPYVATVAVIALGLAALFLR